jgi:hypothetical protein
VRVNKPVRHRGAAVALADDTGRGRGPLYSAGWVGGRDLLGCELSWADLTVGDAVLSGPCGLRRGASGTALWEVRDGTPVLVGVLSGIDDATGINAFAPASRVGELFPR